jgi:ATP-dependent helicase/nuclease subunit A
MTYDEVEMQVSRFQLLDPKQSSWVAASAGTGKTKLLTDRVLSLLLHGVKPSAILCVTYTKAAAAEIQERIYQRLAGWTFGDDTMLRQELAEFSPHDDWCTQAAMRAKALFYQVTDAEGGIAIETIHGFCQHLLSRFPAEAGLPASFDILTAPASVELARQAWNQLLTDMQATPVLLQAFITMATRLDDGRMEEWIQAVLSDRDAWENACAAHLDAPILLEKWLQVPRLTTETELLNKWLGPLAVRRNKMIEAVQCMEQGSVSDQKKARIIASCVEQLEALAPAHMDAYAAVFLTQEGSPQKRPLSQGLLTAHPWLAAWVEQEQRLLLNYFDHRYALALYAFTGAQLVVVKEFLASYTALKQQRHQLDYDDLLVYTIRLLGQSHDRDWVAYQLDQQVQHLLVDEAQDTSMRQWQILAALVKEFFAGDGAQTKDTSLFVVGDEKQSIYSFQGADPQMFQGMYHYWSKLATAAGSPLLHYTMQETFRSTQPVLTLVDALCQDPDVKASLTAEDILYQHLPRRQEAAGRIELWPAMLPDATAEQENSGWLLPLAPTYQHSQAQRLAEQVAGTIADWFETGRVLGSQSRPVQPGDIMLLVRRRGAMVNHLVRSLRKRHISVQSIDRTPLTDLLPIQDMFALGLWAFTPEDDLALATILKGPLYRLNEDQLFVLAYGREGDTLWQCLQQSEWTKIVDELLRIRDAAVEATPVQFLSLLLDQLGMRQRLVAHFGAEVIALLAQLMQETYEFEKSITASLYRFFHEFSTYAGEVSSDTDKDSNAIRILTIHGAKGLQAPIIWLVDTCQPPPSRRMVGWAPTEPPLPFFCWRKQEMPAAARRVVSEAKQQDMAEYWRLLYVAVTRAAEELYITGSYHQEILPAECWYRKLEELLMPCTEQEGEKRWLGYPIVIQKPPPAQKKSSLVLPEWNVPLPLPLSSLPVIESEATLRGTAIHRLLEQLPGLPEAMRASRGRMLLSLLEIPEVEHDGILHEALAVINHPKLAPLFGPESLAEQPFYDPECGQRGVIDRLWLGKDSIWLVDFKTHTVPPPLMPELYQQQLANYARAMSRLYPRHRLRCSIIWTATLKTEDIHI